MFGDEIDSDAATQTLLAALAGFQSQDNGA